MTGTCSSTARLLMTIVMVGCATAPRAPSPATQPAAAAPGEPECSRFPPQHESSYILPFRPGEEYPVWRTAEHYTPRNGGVGRYAIDIGMPIGTVIVAARAGVVVAARDSFVDGNGLDLHENFVFVRHSDGTIGRYFHLTQGGALVAEGDTIGQGDLIARSGNTGQSSGPHLHFDVQACGPNLPPSYNRLPCGRTVPVSFRNTEPHACGLRSKQAYRARPEG